MDIFAVAAANMAQVTTDVDLGTNADGKPFGFVIVGADSPQAYKAERENRARSIERRKANPDLDVKSPEFDALSQELIRENIAHAIASAVVGWYGFTNPDGTPAEFDHAIATAALANRSAWREKLSRQYEDDKNFLPASAQSAKSTPDKSPTTTPPKTPRTKAKE